MNRTATLAALRRRLAGLASGDMPDGHGRVAFGLPELDGHLDGGLVRAALHEIYAAGAADVPAATAVALGLAWRAAHGRPILWVRQDRLAAEAGNPYPPGLAEFGLDPSRFLFMAAPDAAAVLRAGAEGARCAALGAVLIEPLGSPRLLDLTASRRLVLAAQTSGVMTVLLRMAQPSPSAAQTRWLVVGRPSRALEANAPGAPAFTLRLLRHRGGLGEQEWHVEWNRDAGSFRSAAEPSVARSIGDSAPLSRPLAPLPAGGSGDPVVALRRTA
ncbi:hypothetical protein [Bosea sp. 117]|uniref:ImuA family protein n=1 Tax=Bosea sp. 117 TaxID=1125973 RepID=UPI00056E221C|nr:hypothetical protein [Bosea sp. 117]